MPTAVEFIEKLGAVLVQLPKAAAPHITSFLPGDDFTHIGGRSGLGALKMHHSTHAPNQLPAVQNQHDNVIEQLRPALPSITSAIQKVIPNQKSLHVIGVNTSTETLAVLIGLLRAQGFQVNIQFCDGSVRQGFSGPTAVIHGGDAHSLLPAVFLQQVGSARG